jgi:hypothetical protein
MELTKLRCAAVPLSGGLQVDDQLDLGGLLDRQIGRLLSVENAAGIDARKAVGVREASSVAGEALGARRIHETDRLLEAPGAASTRPAVRYD